MFHAQQTFGTMSEGKLNISLHGMMTLCTRHTIVRKLSNICMWNVTSYSRVGQSLGVDHKICKNLCDP
jgi:hypothetical protein